MRPKMMNKKLHRSILQYCVRATSVAITGIATKQNRKAIFQYLKSTSLMLRLKLKSLKRLKFH